MQTTDNTCSPAERSQEPVKESYGEKMIQIESSSPTPPSKDMSE